MPALLATIKTSDEAVALFTGVDPYRFDVDNRPLRNLIDNDLQLQTVLNALSTEVYNARIDNSTGAAVEYSSLDARLEALSIAGLSNSSVSYSIFQAQAERNRALYQSGWLVTPSSKSFLGEYSNFAGDDFGALGGSRTFGFAQTAAEPNALIMNTEFAGQFLPIPLLVNGWLVKMFWQNAGGAAGSASTSYPYNTVKLPAPPSSGGRQDFVFLEVWLKRVSASAPVFWLYGSPQYRAAAHGEGVPVLCTTSDPTDPAYNTGNYTTNPLDQRVVHTLARLNDGDWLQVQHRVRIVTDIDASTVDAFSGTTNQTKVLAQGAQGAPVAGKPYTNMLSTLGDAGLFRAGAGSADTAALGTFDGFSYAVPMTTVHRRNTGVFTMTDQNGAAKSGVAGSGVMSSGVSGRPDALYADEVDRRDYLDQRHGIDSQNTDYTRLLQVSLAEVMKGTSRLQWEKLNYTTDPASALPIYGNRLLTNDTVFDSARYAVGSSAEMQNSNWVADKSISAASYSKPDKVRRVYASNAGQVQRTEFWIDPFTATESLKSQYADITGFITVTKSGDTVTVRIDPTVLSGGTGGGVNSTQLGTRVPVWHWQSDNQGISFDAINAVGGSYAKDFVFDATGRSSEKVLVNVDIIFPAKSGLAGLPTEIIRQDYFDGTNTHVSSSKAASLPYSVAKSTAGQFFATEEFTNQVTCWVTTSGEIAKHSNAAATLNSASVNNWAGGNGFFNPQAVAVFGDPLNDNGTGATGCVYVFELYNQRISKYAYNTATSKWTLLGRINSTQTPGASSAFTLDGIQKNFGGYWVNMAVSSNGTYLYVSACWAHSILRFTTSQINNITQPAATLVAGTHGTAGNTTSAGAVKLNYPLGISADPASADPNNPDLWVADYGNSRVLRMTTAGAATCTVSVQMKDSDGTGGALPASIINSDNIIVCGTPGVNLHYLVVAGESITNVDGNQKVYKLDENFNIVAETPWTMNRIGGLTVDDQANPTYIYVGRSGASFTAQPQLAILNYSNLSLVTNIYGTTLAEMGYIASLQYVPSVGGANWLFANSGNNTFVAQVNGASVYQFQKLVGSRQYCGSGWPAESASDPYSAFFSKMNVIGGVPTLMSVVENATAQTAVGYLNSGTLYKITWNSGTSEWDRTSVTTFNQIPWGVQMDANNNVYVSFPFDANFAFPNYPNGGNVIKRYDQTGALTGTFGNGTAGGSQTQVASPTSMSFIAGTSKLVVAAKKSLPFSGGAEQSRFVFLKTDNASWSGGTMYDSDTNNNAMISVALVSPLCVISDGVDSVFITDLAKKVIYKLKRAVAADSQTYQLVGKFGVADEAGTDHGHLAGAYSMTLDGNFMVIADSWGHRMLRVHQKMAGISLATGNIENMTPLVSGATGTSERLRVWSYNVSYQGVGKNLFAANEMIWSKQVLSSLDSLYVTTLGRSPIRANGSHNNAEYRGCLSRLPLAGKNISVDESTFGGHLMKVGSLLDSHASSLLRLPALTYGFTSNGSMGDSETEGTYIAFIRTEESLKSRIHRGFNSDNGVAGAPFMATEPVKPETDGTYAPRVTIAPYIIKRNGKVYLAMLTQVLNTTTGGQVGIGSWGGGQYTAFDLFEVPGRLLLR